MSFADNLRMMRKFRRLTQSELAEKAGISISSIINYENGRRKDIRNSVVKRLSQTLDFPESFFSSDSELFTDGTMLGLVNHEKENVFLAAAERYVDNQANAALLKAFNELNESGKQVAIERVKELSEIARYHQ